MTRASYQQYDRHSTASIDTVRAAFAAATNGKLNINGELVNGGHSLRVRTFLTKGTVCLHCGLVGSHFALERTGDRGPYHLNLWGFDADGDEHLLTHDHIVARALGGADDISNTQTLCSQCNGKKGKIENKLAQTIRRESLSSTLKESK